MNLFVILPISRGFIPEIMFTSLFLLSVSQTGTKGWSVIAPQLLATPENNPDWSWESEPKQEYQNKS